MPLAETIKELVSFILEGVDLLDHTSIFLLCTINHRVIPIIRILSWFVPTGTSSEVFFRAGFPMGQTLCARLYFSAGYTLVGKTMKRNSIGMIHESIHIISIPQWLIVHKRNILVWSIWSTPFNIKLTNSFMA